MLKDTQQKKNKTIALDSTPKPKKTVRRIRKGLITASVICCIAALLAAVPVIAASFEESYQLMYAVSPSTAQFFKPVAETSAASNVELKVISCSVQKNTVDICISVKDLSGKQFKGSVDLFDSYYINTPFSCSSECSLKSYDDKTKTAVFLITLSRWNKENIQGDKLTFGLESILTGREEHDKELKIDLSSVKETDNTKNVYVSGGGNFDKIVDTQGYTTALTPGKPRKELAINGVDLTGIGYIDGQLHIQYAAAAPFENDNHGYFTLLRTGDPYDEGNNGSEMFYFFDDEKEISYCEIIYDIPQSELKNYSIYAHFTTSSCKIDGPWRVTFPIGDK